MTGRRRTAVARTVLLTAASLALPGCLMFPLPARHGTPLDKPGRDALRAADAQAAIAPGRTTMEELVFAWGPPDRVRDDGTIAIWLGDVVDFRLVFVILIPGGGGAAPEASHFVALAVRFDSHGVVERWEPLEGGNSLIAQLEEWR